MDTHAITEGAKCKSHGPPPTLMTPLGSCTSIVQCRMPPPPPPPGVRVPTSAFHAKSVESSCQLAFPPVPQPPPGLQVEVSRGDVKVAMKCFDSSVISDLVPAVKQIVDMLEEPATGSGSRRLHALSGGASGSQHALLLRDTDSHHGDVGGNPGWLRVQYSQDGEDDLDVYFRVIKVFYSDSSLMRCIEHGAEYKLDGGYFVPVSLRGLLFKDIRIHELGQRDVRYHWGHVYMICLELRSMIIDDPYRPRNALEMHWESLQHCKSQLHNQTTTLRLSVCFPAYLEVLSGLSLTAPNIMTFLEEHSPVVMSLKGFDTRIEKVKVVYSTDGEPCAIVLGLKYDEDCSPRILRAKHFVHATHTEAAKSILATHVILPSLFDVQDNSWLPPTGFYARAQRAATRLSIESMCIPPDSLWLHALQFSDVRSVKSMMICGLAYCRQSDHAVVRHGGVAADIAAGYYFDVVHSVSHKRWLVRSSIAKITGVAIGLKPARFS